MPLNKRNKPISLLQRNIRMKHNNIFVINGVFDVRIEGGGGKGSRKKEEGPYESDEEGLHFCLLLLLLFWVGFGPHEDEATKKK